MALWSILLEIFKRPTLGDALADLVMFMVPLWIAVIAGVLVGWAWKPKWANLRRVMDSSITLDSANTVASRASSSVPAFNPLKIQLPSFISWVADDGIQKETSSVPPNLTDDCRFVRFYSSRSQVSQQLKRPPRFNFQLMNLDFGN